MIWTLQQFYFYQQRNSVQGCGRVVPRQLQHRHPHRQHLAHPLPRRLEVHHDKVPLEYSADCWRVGCVILWQTNTHLHMRSRTHLWTHNSSHANQKPLNFSMGKGKFDRREGGLGAGVGKKVFGEVIYIARKGTMGTIHHFFCPIFQSISTMPYPNSSNIPADIHPISDFTRWPPSTAPCFAVTSSSFRHMVSE